MQIIRALSALGQDTRLSVFRLLLKASPNAVVAGNIAIDLEVIPATLSRHLKELVDAGLVSSARSGREISYSVNIEGTRELLSFLVFECCNGHPDLCFSGEKRSDFSSGISNEL